MSNLTEKRKLGNLGEEIACRFLRSKGHEIIEQNYLKKFGEIDIVAKKHGIIHFIEVKSVSCENLDYVSPTSNNLIYNKTDNYRPEDNLHPWKLRRLFNTIQVYLSEKRVSSETQWQFDIITVYIDKIGLISKVYMLENVIL